jgi:hypothetical protein
MEIRELALKLNEASKDYKIGNLQEIRKEIKGLKRLPGKNIFNLAKIKDHTWAFHIGGRPELQFNIGLEEEGIRYGLAFSLETSRSFTDTNVRDLYKKILRLNCIILEKPELFSEYIFLYWYKKRSQPSNMRQIPVEIIKPGYFIFFGKLVNEHNLDINEILREFDKMLSIYLLVESTSNTDILIEQDTNEDFRFIKQERSIVLRREYSSVERETNIEIRHSYLQLQLKDILEKKYGAENVRLEHPCGGNSIDAVVRHKSDYYFYEIKIANSSRSCIRQALGQILDYSYWPGKKKANRLTIVGEHPLNEVDKKYIDFLNAEFSLPIDYMTVSLTN